MRREDESPGGRCWQEMLEGRRGLRRLSRNAEDLQKFAEAQLATAHDRGHPFWRSRSNQLIKALTDTDALFPRQTAAGPPAFECGEEEKKVLPMVGGGPCWESGWLAGWLAGPGAIIKRNHFITPGN